MSWTDQKVRWEISGKVILIELKIGDNKINGAQLIREAPRKKGYCVFKLNLTKLCFNNPIKQMGAFGHIKLFQTVTMVKHN